MIEAAENDYDGQCKMIKWWLGVVQNVYEILMMGNSEKWLWNGNGRE